MKYLFILALFALGMVMLGGQHTHYAYQVYGVADANHSHAGEYAECGHRDSISCDFSRGTLHSH